MGWKRSKGAPPFEVGELTNEVRRMLTAQRNLLGLTQRQVAEAMVPPVSPAAVHELECTVGNLTIYKVEHWCAALGLRMQISFSFVPDDDEPD